MLFMVTAPYTWANVSEILLLRFFMANTRDDTSSEALEAMGVTTNEMKKDEIPEAAEKDETASTMGSAITVLL